ncbi:ribosome assembly cofactor RimP, partial [Escherichia coli]
MKLSNKSQALYDMIAPAAEACGVDLWGIEFLPQG